MVRSYWYATQVRLSCRSVFNMTSYSLPTALAALSAIREFFLDGQSAFSDHEKNSAWTYIRNSVRLRPDYFCPSEIETDSLALPSNCRDRIEEIMCRAYQANRPPSQKVGTLFPIERRTGQKQTAAHFFQLHVLIPRLVPWCYSVYSSLEIRSFVRLDARSNRELKIGI